MIYTRNWRDKEMSIKNAIGITIAGLLLISALPAQAQRRGGRNARPGMGGGICWNLLNSVPKGELDSNEAAGLTYLREEEKLARDVYLALYSKWGAPIFGNISVSENRHSSALKLLLDRYGLADPAENAATGHFKDSALQALYADLTAQAEASLSAALRVGATIEDLDFHDLGNAITATDNEDLKIVYRNLQRGTQNHMEAFLCQLDAEGETYTAQYMDPEILDAMLSSTNGGMGFGRGRNGSQRLGRGTGNCLWRNNPPSSQK